MKSIFALGWRRWSIVLFGVVLFSTPWLLGTPTEDESSVNSWIVGLGLILVAWRLPIVASYVAASLAGTLLAGWLLISPFALDFVGSAAAWCAWVTGGLALALFISLEAIFDVAAWLQVWRLRDGIRQISPQQIARYEETTVQTDSAQMLSRSIVERAHQIERTMRRHPSEPETEMCILGYGACVTDMVTLVHMIEKERPEAGPILRLRLRLGRNMAERSLSCARQELPTGALRVSRA